jgi:hypothetical protein
MESVTVIPAEAGIQRERRVVASGSPRFCGDDEDSGAAERHPAGFADASDATLPTTRQAGGQCAGWKLVSSGDDLERGDSPQAGREDALRSLP